MPEAEQQDKTLSELVVKEAVGRGLESPMRDSILEAVEEADGSGRGTMRNLPIAGALVGLGAAVGFLAGRESFDLEDRSLEDVQEPEIIDDVMETDEESTTEAEDETEEAESTETESSSRRLPRALLVLGVLAGIAILRRRLGGEEDEEWEPIEEFEPATSTDDESDDAEETGAEADEGESDDDAAEAAGDETEE